jgi:pyrimidine-nucleoside phosphorylase
MNAVDLIRAKRDGAELTAEQIDWLVAAYTNGQVTDYQMSAFLMATLWRGMTPAETVRLTFAMVDSGTRLRLGESISPVADKHSTGGVGDKVTLVVAPLAAACGLPVGKMSGRGLGHTGGTIDKLESISGLRTKFTPRQFVSIVRKHGIAIAAQSSTLAPADGKMYALRDVTATVDSIPLIAASIMSKKLAIGPTHLLLDVKVGAGAFMKTEASARELAEMMVRIGEEAGIRTVAFLTAMDQPLGCAVGNALEVAEAIELLRGSGPDDLAQLCLHEVATLLHMAGLAAGEAEGEARARRAMEDGSGLAKFAEVVAAQGGDATQVEHPAKLPHAPHREMLAAPRDGYIASIDAEQVGRASVRLGAGRQRKGDPIDPRVGLMLQAKVGDRLTRGQPLLEIHAAAAEDAAAIHEELLGAYSWSKRPPTVQPLLLGSVGRP